jgi:hypothetical protein
VEGGEAEGQSIIDSVAAMRPKDRSAKRPRAPAEPYTDTEQKEFPSNSCIKALLEDTRNYSLPACHESPSP